MVDYMAGEFEWGDEKNATNLKKHGISFEEAIAIFDGPVLTNVDDRFDYGEIREISIGFLGDTVVLSVTHTERDQRKRLISARKASRAERRMFYDYLERTLGRN